MEQRPAVADDEGPAAPRSRLHPDPRGDTPGRDLLRALVGSAIALTGVVLGIGALLMLRGHGAPAPGSGPVIEVPSTGLARSLPGTPAAMGTPAPPAQSPTVTTATTTPVPTATVPTTPAPPPSAVQTPASAPPLTVLNDSRIAGLASRAAASFRAAGWPVAEVGNFAGRVPVTTAYYPPDGQAAARALADRFPAIRRVLPRFAGLPGSGLTVVVTREYAG